MKTVKRIPDIGGSYYYPTVFGGQALVLPNGRKYWHFQSEKYRYVARFRPDIEFKYAVKILIPTGGPMEEVRTIWGEGRTRRDAFKELRSHPGFPLPKKS